MAQDTRIKHVVLVNSGGWGHIRSLLQFGLTLMLSASNVHLTALGTSTSASKIIEEVERQRHLTDDQKARIQVLEVREEMREWTELAKQEGELSEDNMPGLSGAWLDLCQLGKESELGDKFRSVPQLCIYDTFLYIVPSINRAIAQRYDLPTIPCLLLAPVPTSTMRAGLLPKKYGGRYEGFEDRLKAAQDAGMDDGDAAMVAWLNPSDELVEESDYPPLYGYQYNPSALDRPLPAPLVKMIMNMMKRSLEGDGYVTFGVPEIEEHATKLMRQVLEIPLYAVGPRLDLATWRDNDPTVRTTYNTEEKAIMAFLDGAVAQHGPGSVAYISLGTAVWPAIRPYLINYLVETLLAAKRPQRFLFATAAGVANIPQDIKDKVHISGKGMIVPWAPQMTVLQHPALRFFLTHCGSGSSIEAINAEIPVVTWPYFGDQTIWSHQFAQLWKAGIQLYQVAAGMTGKPLAHGGTVVGTEEAIKEEMSAAWEAMYDEDEYRTFKENMGTVKKTIETSCATGQASENLRDLVQTYLQ